MTTALAPLTITITRHVAVWFYFLSGVTALFAVWWMAQRRLLRLGTRLLTLGILVNAVWELLLFTVWTRRYDTIVPTSVHAIYQSLTEFGPLLVLAVLILNWSGQLDLSPWTEPQSTRVHRDIRVVSATLCLAWITLGLGTLLSTPEFLTTQITVYREVTEWYFLAELTLVITVLTLGVRRGDHTALTLFLFLGAFNVLFEAIGLIAGYRSYAALHSATSILIGFAESGTAAALVWIISMRVSSYSPSSSPMIRRVD